MQNEDEKNNEKKAEGGKDESELATGDGSSEKNTKSSGDNSHSSNPVICPGAPTPAAALLQVARDSTASSGIQPLHPEPRTKPTSGQDPSVSNLKKNLNLDLRSQTPRLPLPLSEDDTTPGSVPYVRLHPNIPIVAIDGSRCVQSASSEESLKSHLYGMKKVDNLEVDVASGKRKTRTSPIRDNYGSDNSSSSELSADRKDPEEKPRQKKSQLSRLLCKSPLRSKEKLPKDSTTKRDKSPKEPRSKRDKSPSYSQVKRDKSPTYPHGKRDKSPKDSSDRAKSPSKFAGFFKGTKDLFSKRDDKWDEESKPLCEIKEGSPKKVIKETKPAKSHSKDHDLTEGFVLEKDVNSSDTTCDSTNTRFSRASISTDSPMSEAGNAIRTNTPDDETSENSNQESANLETPENPESPNPEDDDCKMDEN